jgi:uncharacterized glyoxalase superfamily protein PhnB
MSFDAVGIVSENPQRSIEFFKILGVEIKQYENSSHYEGVTESGVRIMLDSLEFMMASVPGFVRPSGARGITLCFKQNSPEKVNSLYQALTAAGFQGIKPPWDAFWGQRYACISDPDGNQVDLFASL